MISKLDLQLHVSRHRSRELSSNTFRHPTNSMAVKPMNGLWTSTLDPTIGSAWIQLLDKSKVAKEGATFDVYVVRPFKVLRVYELNTVQDFSQLVGTYPRWTTNEFQHPYDVEAMARDYDCIHLTKEGALNLTRCSTLATWEVESTLWLNWCMAVQRIGTLEYKVCDVRSGYSTHTQYGRTT